MAQKAKRAPKQKPGKAKPGYEDVGFCGLP